MQSRFAPRFDYGQVEPWLEQKDKFCWRAITGPHRLLLQSELDWQRAAKGSLTAEWFIQEGETYSFVLQHSCSYQDEPQLPNPILAEQQCREHWKAWSAQSTYHGPYKDVVDRSVLTLKALTFEPSGGFVAAPTTSLPEKVGGARNWDYRYCWLRDSTFNLLGLLHCGYRDEAKAWLSWLSRALQGNPDSLKILYGISGKREHGEWIAHWLPGYEGSKPVHIGNKASEQLQLDIFGEVLDALYRARLYGLYPLQDKSGEALELPLLEHLEKIWQEPDAGLWEFRSGNKLFTQSKVMAWVAFDRGIRMIEELGMTGPLDRWRKIRTTIHAEICKLGFHKGLNSFTQTYGSRQIDASLLMLPLVGFLPVDDPRITGTVHAIEQRLTRKGLLYRYDTAKVNDGLPPGEGAFLACNFWLVEVYLLQRRHKQARDLFEKLISLANDLGLLSEEYDPRHGLIGNFPQAFSHIGLINAALSLEKGTSIRLADLKQV